jgi:hypothetical protein
MNQALADRQIQATYIAAGDRKTKLLNLGQVRADFDKAVLSDPEIVTDADEWREVFGLRHG